VPRNSTTRVRVLSSTIGLELKSESMYRKIACKALASELVNAQGNSQLIFVDVHDKLPLAILNQSFPEKLSEPYAEPSPESRQ